MTTDLYGRVLFSDGEALDTDDLNAIAARGLAQIFDQVLAALAPDRGSAVDPSMATGTPFGGTGRVFALTVAGGRPIQGSASNKLKMSAGTLLAAQAGPDGAEPQLLAYTFDGTEVELTIADGGGANPRVDILQMKLEYVEDTSVLRDFEDAATRAHSSQSVNTRRRVQCTLQIKQGTPAASPVYPAPDAGFNVVAGILVSATFTSAGTLSIEDTAAPNATLHDHRLPLGVRPVTVRPTDFHYDSTWSLDSFRDTLVAGVAPNAMSIPVPTIAGRVIAASVFMKEVSTQANRFAKYKLANNAGALSVTHVILNNGNLETATPTQYKHRIAFTNQWEQVHTPATGATVAAGTFGPPIWTNGKRAPDDFAAASSPQPFESAELQFPSPVQNMAVGPVTFWIATGL